MLPAATTPTYANGVVAGTVTSSEIWEASGLVASRQNLDVLYTHNDSGYRGTIFAIATNGTLLGRLVMSNVFYGDFEDIAIGPGPLPGREYIYLGDIGDNTVTRSSIRVFRFPEPAVYAYHSNGPVTQPITTAQEIVMRYPDGSYNAEAMMVDPRTGDLFIATKLTNSCRIYRATRTELSAGGTIQLTFVGENSFQRASGGDVSPDGSLAALRRGNRISMWSRQSGQSVGSALTGSSFNTPVIGDADGEPNGEAIGYAADNSGYYTLSEGSQQPLFYFRRTDAGIPPAPRVLIRAGEIWHYQDFGFDEGAGWRLPDYDDTWWNSGPAQLGYGQGDEATVVNDLGGPFDRIPTTYFRKAFNLSAGTAPTNLVMRLCFNDGVAVYLNGAEILRRNLPSPASFSTLAVTTNGAQQNVWLTVPVKPSLLRAGQNVIAAEIHRASLDGSDLSFDLQLLEGIVEAPPRFTAPPQFIGGECRLNFAGPTGAVANIEVAENLLRWQPVRPIVLTNGLGSYREAVTNGVTRLFRLGQ